MRIIPFLLLPFFATGCMPPMESSQREVAAPPMEMRVYDVPAGQKAFIARTINSAMSAETRQGRALEGPADTVVVVAPETLHAGVASLVAKVESGPPASQAVTNVEIRYWVVRAAPSETPNIAPALAPVTAALTEIMNVDGPAAFELVARRRVQTMNGRNGSLNADDLTIDQDVAVSHDQSVVHANLHVSLNRRNSFRTELSLKPNALAVLAQSTVDGDAHYIIVQPVLK